MLNSWLPKAFAILLSLTTMAVAQQYPTKPIRLIIPFPPGGTNDVMGRLIATQLGERLGRQVIPDNRGGAGAIIGTEIAANAPKDGYTILIISLTHTVSPWLRKVPYDPIKSFSPVAMLGAGPNVIVVHPSFPVHSIKELIALAKKQPGHLPYASSGIGTYTHLGAEMFKLQAGINLLHVPFRGGGPATIDVVAGHTKIMFSNLLTAIPHIRAGRLRAIAVGGAKRTPVLPDVPTVAEAGLPGYEPANWWGIVAPAGTPPAIVERLHREISTILDSPALQRQLSSDGAEVVHMSSAAFGEFIVKELAKWGRVVKQGGITGK
jgi:tripartite-type tricarboxylate transporter receptor subunit TctC